jgi:hypothetical protein
MTPDTDLLDQPVTAFQWGEGHVHHRALNVMKAHTVYVNGEYLRRPIVTLRDLTTLTATELFATPNVGRKTLAAIITRLTELGLHLAVIRQREDAIGKETRARLFTVAENLQAALRNDRFPERTGPALLDAIREIQAILGE